MIPVRCFTCGKVLGNLEDTFNQHVKNGKSIKQSLDEIRLIRYCCRTIMMTYSKHN